MKSTLLFLGWVLTSNAGPALALASDVRSAGLAAPVTYRVNCIFNDSELFEPTCEASISLRSPNARGDQEDSMVVVCSKGEPLYQGKAIAKATRDLTMVRTPELSPPSITLPGSALSEPISQEVGATLSLPDATLVGSCDIHASVN